MAIHSFWVRKVLLRQFVPWAGRPGFLTHDAAAYIGGVIVRNGK